MCLAKRPWVWVQTSVELLHFHCRISPTYWGSIYNGDKVTCSQLNPSLRLWIWCFPGLIIPGAGEQRLTVAPSEPRAHRVKDWHSTGYSALGDIQWLRCVQCISHLWCFQLKMCLQGHKYMSSPGTKASQFILSLPFINTANKIFALHLIEFFGKNINNNNES
jgi:hypothetical protein